MSARISLATRIDDYIAERHRLGFELHSRDTLLAGFARYVASQHHRYLPARPRRTPARPSTSNAIELRPGTMSETSARTR